MKLVSLVLLGLASFAGAQAQSFPEKPIRIVSTFPAGGAADGMMRLVGQKMAESLGQPVVIDVRPGAGGVVGAQQVLNSPADGYTLLHSAPTTLVATPFLLKKPPYDPLRDFTYITHLTDATVCLLVANGVPISNVKELIAYARANPGKLSYGSNGVGASYHLEMELLKQKYRLDIVHVPYKGGLEGLQAAAAGQIPVAFATVASAVPTAKSGKVRLLALMAAKRLPDVNLPAMGEELNDYEKIPTGDEITGPAGMPRAVTQRLNAEIRKALSGEEVATRLKQIGFVAAPNSPEEHAAQMRQALDIMGRAIKAAKIQPE